MIITNILLGGNEEHILHFHGNHFYIVGYRQFDRPLTRKEVLELDANDDLVKRNLRNAPLKDTVRVPKFGVVILRFLANNPGEFFTHSVLLGCNLYY